MHIVYIHQHFATNEGFTGTRSYDVSRHLVAMGHQVTMICGIADIGGLKPMRRFQMFRRDNIDGINVVVCNVKYSNHMNPLARMWAFFFFAVLASIAGSLARKPDVIFATHTPLTVGFPGYIAGRLHRRPFVFEVRDLWPEALVVSGELKPGPMLWVMSAMERFFYRTATRILVVSPGFEKRLIERGYPAAKVKTVLLGADGELFKDAAANPDFRRNYGLDDAMVAIFTGAHGWSNGLDYVLDAAAHLKNRDDIRIVFLGEGREKPRLKERCRKEELHNCLFIDAVQKKQLPGILVSCDVGLMILRHIGKPRPVTPNKVFDYMFAGLPTIVNFPGCTREMVETDGTGIGVDPENPLDMAQKLEELAQNSERRREMGRLARETAYRKYTRRAIAAQLVKTLEDVCRGQG